MAELEIKYSGELFLANGQQCGFAYDFRKAAAAGSWIRPSVNHTSSSDSSSALEYVSEYAFWDEEPVPPYWGLTLRASGNSDFFFSMILVTP